MKLSARLGSLLWLALLQISATTAIGGDSLTLAFGSCLRQWQPPPVWNAIHAVKPEVFVFAGDNVHTGRGPYAWMPEPERIRIAYEDCDDRRLPAPARDQ